MYEQGKPCCLDDRGKASKYNIRLQNTIKLISAEKSNENEMVKLENTQTESKHAYVVPHFSVGEYVRVLDRKNI